MIDIVIFKLIPEEYMPLVAPLSLVIIGLIAEKHFVGRLSTFSNVIALNLFFYNVGSISLLFKLYLTAGLVIGLIALIAYFLNESLKKWFYMSTWAYCSIIVGVLIIVSHSYISESEVIPYIQEADLYISNVEQLTDPCQIGQICSWNITIQWTGPYNTSTYSLSTYYDGEPDFKYMFISESGIPDNITIKYVPRDDGKHSLRLMLDEENNVDETNEDNNEYVKHIVVENQSDQSITKFIKDLIS